MLPHAHARTSRQVLTVNRETYEGRNFHHVRYLNTPGLFSGIAVQDCEFLGCVFGQQSDAGYPVRVLDTTVSGCRFVNNSVVGVSFEDVAVTDCATVGDPLTLEGCVFRRVILRGRVGSWIMNDLHRSFPDDVRAAFSRAERDFYSQGEYALDISEAVFESASLYYLPGDLVKRDPETQFLVRKENLLGADLSALSKIMQRRLKRVERNPFDSTVLVVGRDDENFKKNLPAYRQLVDLGIADP